LPLLLLLSSSSLLDYHVFLCLGFVIPLRGVCLVPTESDSATTKDSLLTTRLSHCKRAVAGTGRGGLCGRPRWQNEYFKWKKKFISCPQQRQRGNSINAIFLSTQFLLGVAKMPSHATDYTQQQHSH